MWYAHPNISVNMLYGDTYLAVAALDKEDMPQSFL